MLSLWRVAFNLKRKKLPLPLVERIFRYVFESDKTQHALMSARQIVPVSRRFCEIYNLLR